MENEEVLLTQEGYEKLENQLENLKTVERTAIAERIKIALGYGDLSENSEYDEAKSAQEANENKIIELENKLRHAEIDTKTVQVGNIVKVHNLVYDEEAEYTIVGSTEVDLLQNKISNQSPIGSALLGAKKGQKVDVNLPNGKVLNLQILSIKK